MKKKKISNNEQKEILNGITIQEMELDQEGNLTVTFDRPVEQESTCYELSLTGQRVLDVYEYPDLEKAAKELFQAARKHMFARPDETMDKVDCDRCKEAPCCREYNAILRDSDIERLRGDMPRAEFIRKYTVPAVDWSGDFHYQMKCDTDEEGEKCVFLRRNKNGIMRCSVYGKRPQICRDFDMAVCDDFQDPDEADDDE